MLNLRELLNSNSFLLLENPSSKKMVFDKMCNKAFEEYNIDKNLLLNNLIKREKIVQQLFQWDRDLCQMIKYQSFMYCNNTLRRS